ncbi:hypothetical protein PsYK624_118870 [Phanerochaete sordida]|uniref:Uncharacterized protein n=1 Tax=Phanerochaete sordida TaxID=48140 RepID=A0A9P3GJ28_9APHY|nr:hypothetical protein PsYK624_118870 [Phanerochaete sordida]
MVSPLTSRCDRTSRGAQIGISPRAGVIVRRIRASCPGQAEGTRRPAAPGTTPPFGRRLGRNLRRERQSAGRARGQRHDAGGGHLSRVPETCPARRRRVMRPWRRGTLWSAPEVRGAAARGLHAIVATADSLARLLDCIRSGTASPMTRCGKVPRRSRTCDMERVRLAVERLVQGCGAESDIWCSALLFLKGLHSFGATTPRISETAKHARPMRPSLAVRGGLVHPMPAKISFPGSTSNLSDLDAARRSAWPRPQVRFPGLLRSPPTNIRRRRDEEPLGSLAIGPQVRSLSGLPPNEQLFVRSGRLSHLRA